MYIRTGVRFGQTNRLRMVGYAPAGGVGMLDPPASQQAEQAGFSGR